METTTTNVNAVVLENHARCAAMAAIVRMHCAKHWGKRQVPPAGDVLPLLERMRMLCQESWDLLGDRVERKLRERSTVLTVPYSESWYQGAGYIGFVTVVGQVSYLSMEYAKLTAMSSRVDFKDLGPVLTGTDLGDLGPLYEDVRSRVLEEWNASLDDSSRVMAMECFRGAETMWRPVAEPGYEHLYEVSNQGIVRRVLGEGKYRYLKPSFNVNTRGQSTYTHVRLSCEGKVKTRTIHVLVMEAWVGPRPRREGMLMDIDHANDCPWDNRLENLAYVTRSHNLRKMPDVGDRRRKLDEADVVVIRAAFHSGKASMRELARKYGVTVGTVSNLVRGKSWASVPMPEVLRKPGAYPTDWQHPSKKSGPAGETGSEVDLGSATAA